MSVSTKCRREGSESYYACFTHECHTSCHDTRSPHSLSPSLPGCISLSLSLFLSIAPVASSDWRQRRSKRRSVRHALCFIVIRRRVSVGGHHDASCSSRDMFAESVVAGLCRQPPPRATQPCCSSGGRRGISSRTGAGALRVRELRTNERASARDSRWIDSTL